MACCKKRFIHKQVFASFKTWQVFIIDCNWSRFLTLKMLSMRVWNIARAFLDGGYSQKFVMPVFRAENWLSLLCLFRSSIWWKPLSKSKAKNNYIYLIYPVDQLYLVWGSGRQLVFFSFDSCSLPLLYFTLPTASKITRVLDNTFLKTNLFTV